MNKLFLGAALAGAMTLAAGAVNAAVYTSLLEYDSAATPLTPSASGPFGKVTITDGLNSGQDVLVEVTLFSPEIGFLNTGGPHEPFTFNLTGNYGVTLGPNDADQSFAGSFWDSNGTVTQPNFTETPFGNFTNYIGCCAGGNGSGNASAPPLVFTVHNDTANGGLTFGGVGATIVNGKLTTLGTGPHFNSNSGGWWFGADVTDGTNTFSVAARDALVAVPEPSTWALMIVGFGGAGALLRRRRTAVAVA